MGHYHGTLKSSQLSITTFQEFIQCYRDLVHQCSASQSDTTPEHVTELADYIERMIVIVEYCTQVLESTTYHAELSLLSNMHQTLTKPRTTCILSK